MQRLRERLLWYGLTALGVAAALTSVLWGWLIWMLRRGDATG